MAYSEQSRTKCIGLTIETRPDYCLPPHLAQMLSYGCTRSPPPPSPPARGGWPPPHPGAPCMPRESGTAVLQAAAFH